MVSGSTNSLMGSVNRRRVLQSIGIASAAALAGRTSQEDSALGERVPTLVLNFWSDQGTPTILFEETISTLQEDIGDIGLSIDTVPTTTGQGILSQADDDRSFHLAVNSYGPSPSRLDPNELLRNFEITNAGANGAWNPSNYTSCEFTELSVEQETTGDPDERRSVVDEAFRVFSADVPVIPLIDRPLLAAINTEQVDAIEPGEMALTDTTWAAFLESAPGITSETDAIFGNLPQEHLISSFYPLSTDVSSMGLMTNLVNSPLIGYDKNYELEGVLAESWEISDDGTTFTFELYDATFHNGDPIRPEDVKWTYEFLREQFEEGVYEWTEIPELESIEEIDDRTVQINTVDPTPTLETAVLPQFGVLAKDPLVEAGIENNPTDFEDPMIGCGPYRITSYQTQEHVALEPFDDHPIYSPQADLILQIYDSTQTVRRAFQNEELNLAVGLDPSSADQLEVAMGDRVEILSGASFLPFVIHPTMSYGPAKFLEFRKAFSYMIDRARLNETFAFGESTELVYSSFLSPVHPWYNEDVLTRIADESVNVERARELLGDEGWEWDDNGNLHYPSDADLSPVWEEGGTPDPDDFPCLG